MAKRRPRLLPVLLVTPALVLLVLFIEFMSIGYVVFGEKSTGGFAVLFIVLGAFLIGMAEELSVLVVGSQYRAVVGFVAILAVLTLRPRGLLGERAY